MEGISSNPSTFLSTDIEGSTRLWEANPSQMYACLSRHDTIVTETIASHNGVVFKASGDSFNSIFTSVNDAVAAAISIQIKMAEEPWPADSCIRIRIAIHSGEVHQTGSEIYGTAVSRVVLLMGIAHGGQILVSQSTRNLLNELPSDTAIVDLGEHRLQDLAVSETVYQLVHARLQRDFPALNSLTNLQNNLPRQLTSFVGRTKEISEVKGLLKQTRLLSIIGMGGCGKSRLCLQVAAGMVHVFQDGVWFIELAVLSNPTQLLTSMSIVLGVPETSGSDVLQAICVHLKNRHTLIIMDNCEHLISVVAPVVDELLKSCSSLKILVTSRERLNLSSETVYRIPTLTVPVQMAESTLESVQEFEGVQLFLDRARSQAAEFQITDDNAEILGSLCRKLDGIPLAIELAASRVRTMGLQELDRRMEQRFRILTGGGRTVAGRQQTLKGLIDWSYDLLTPDEKSLFQYSAIYRGSWTRESILFLYEECGRDLSEFDSLLTSLVEKSLINFDGTRYYLLETVREYGMEKLKLNPEYSHIQLHHHNWFLKVAENSSAALKTPEHKAALEALVQDYDNIREAILYSMKNCNTSCKFGRVLKMFWEKRGLWTEGRLLLKEILEDVDAKVDPLDYAGCLYTLGSLTYYQNENLEAVEVLEKSLSIYREIHNSRGISAVLNMLGNIATDLNNYSDAEARYLEALELYRESGDLSGEAIELGNLGALASDMHNYPLARKYGEQALVVNGQTGNRNAEVYCHILLGTCAYWESDYQNSQKEFELALQISNEIGERRIQAAMLFNLGHLQREHGEYLDAEKYYSRAFMLNHEMGNRSYEADVLSHLALVAIYKEDYNSAREYFRAMDEVVLTLDHYDGEVRSLLYKMELAIYESTFDRAEKLGISALNLSEAGGDTDGLIFSMMLLSLLNLVRMNYDYSSERIREGLRLSLEAAGRQYLLEAMFVCSLLLHEMHNYILAAKCCGTTETLRNKLGIVLPPQKQRMWVEMTSSLHSTLGDSQFLLYWTEGSECNDEDMAKYLISDVLQSQST